MVKLFLKPRPHEKSEDFIVEFPRPLNLKKLALQSFSLYVSWHNIDETNNTFSYYDGFRWIDLTIPEGRYSIKDLNEYMFKYFGEDSPIQFGIVEARQRVSIKLQDDYKIDLSKSDLYKLLGFEPIVYEDNEIEAKYIADIERGNDIIFIHCDAVDGSYINDMHSDIIHIFTTSNRSGSQYSKYFDSLYYFPVKSNTIRRIRMKITNHRHELMNLHGQDIHYVLIGE